MDLKRYIPSLGFDFNRGVAKKFSRGEDVNCEIHRRIYNFTLVQSIARHDIPYI